MKAVRVVVKLVVCLVVLLLAAVLALPLWFGPVAKTVANKVVPGIVKADFSLGHLSLNPYTARFELGGLTLGNPEGYSVKDAVMVGEVIADAETLSLLTDVIHVEEIAVRDLFVSVVSGGENKVLNFKQIQYNVAGGKEKVEAASAGKKPAEAPAGEVSEPAKEAAPAAEEKPSKKIIIDRLEVSGLTLQLSTLPIRLPSVVLTDIGRKSGGATLEEAWQQIVDGVMKVSGVTSDQLKALGALSGDAVKKAGDAVKKADDAVKQADKAVSKATKAMDDLVDGNAKGVNESVKKASDSAKKALDSLKSLW